MEEVHIRNWASEVKCILAECNLLPWWQSNPCGNGLSPKELKEVVSCCLFRCERERWKTETVNKPKLRTYIPFKNTYEPERYTKSIRCKAHRSLLAQLRGGTAQLEIETGRYVGIPPDQMFCKLCKDAVEDEVHFCTTCPVTHPTFPGNGGHSTRFQ